MFIVKSIVVVDLAAALDYAAELDDDSAGALAGGYGEAVCGLSVAGRELWGRLRTAARRWEEGRGRSPAMSRALGEFGQNLLADKKVGTESTIGFTNMLQHFPIDEKYNFFPELLILMGKCIIPEEFLDDSINVRFIIFLIFRT